MSTSSRHCRSCGFGPLKPFHVVPSVPIHSCRLVENLEQSLAVQRGAIDLEYCRACEFVQNSAFDQALMTYDESYEDTQGYSPQFDVYANGLASSLVQRYGLKTKRVLEIGCGQGDFLKRLSAAGARDCIGFDPAFRGDQQTLSALGIDIRQEYFSDRHLSIDAGFIICRHTLEHIPDVFEFASLLKRAASRVAGAVVCVEVPDVERILEEEAFWDIYYEHCSYFCIRSLTNLFDRCGFHVLDVQRTYGEQYLVIEASVAGLPLRCKTTHGASIEEHVSSFARNVAAKRESWRKRLDTLVRERKGIVLWGSGSKALGFVTALGVEDEVRYIVDINPNKRGFLQIGSRQQIIGPEDLRQVQPDLVIVMNPVYRDEIERDLQRLGLHPEVAVV